MKGPRAIATASTESTREPTLSSRVIGRVGGALLVLCGLQVTVAGSFMPMSVGVVRPDVVIIGLAAAACGLVAWVIPWQRWDRSVSLWAVPLMLALIAAHDYYTGNDGFVYSLFYVVAFVWIGLGQRTGTALKFSPFLAVAYLVPFLLRTHHSAIGPASAAYVVPCCVILGETVSWVSGRLIRSELAVSRSEARFRALVEGAADVITLFDADGRILFETPAVAQVLGYGPTDRVGRPTAEYIHPLDRDDLGSTFRSLLGRPGSIARTRARILHADGTYRSCEATLRNLLHEPAVAAIVANFSDVTARRLAEERLVESESNFRQLFASNPQPMWVHDRFTGAFLEVNSAAVAHYGYDRSQFLAMTVADLSPLPDSSSRDLECSAARMVTLAHKLSNGRVITAELARHLIEFAGRDAVLVAVKDITDQRALEAQLTHQAFHDPLTGLPNRALFRERVEHALLGRDGPNAHVLFIDLDRFKYVNDTLGHAAGDSLLVSVASRLVSVLRAEDTLARLGGDEFGVLVERMPNGGSVVANRLLRSLQEPFTIEGVEVAVSASIGIANSSSGETEEVMRNADMAMYRAKAAGRSRYEIFDPAVHKGIRERLLLESDLGRAVDRGQLRVMYQPTIALQTETVGGAEALLRWEHPEMGTVSPVDFVPIAEESGLIVPIGAWVLREAVRQAVVWRALPGAGAFTMAVNVSARQLQESAFVELVRSALAESGLPAPALTLEITESVLADQTDVVRQRLIELKELGVRIAIDDFGTGYSSLAYLRQFPVDILKVDQSFTSLIERVDHVPPLIEGLIHLGRQLGLEMVAEGIEIPEQHQQLKNLGCTLGQGFLWSRPVTTEVFDTYLIRDGLDPAESALVR